MAKQICPGCGGTYNGKRCLNCGYIPFSEGSKQTAPKAPPVPKKKRRHPIAGFLVLLALIAALLPILRSWGLHLEQIEQDSLSVRQEYVSSLPEGTRILYLDAQIEVGIDWGSGSAFTGSSQVYLRNTTRQEVTLSFQDIQVNGLPADAAVFQGTGRPGEITILTFQPQTAISPDDVTSIVFRLEIHETGSSRLLAEVTPVVLTTAS
ncbi:MAG: hypothetical protein J6V25_12205 [Oscillospiraceae bacterium]|nr:hypothetical protein [Oscillospiraceae bacterium]